MLVSAFLCCALLAQNPANRPVTKHEGRPVYDATDSYTVRYERKVRANIRKKQYKRRSKTK